MTSPPKLQDRMCPSVHSCAMCSAHSSMEITAFCSAQNCTLSCSQLTVVPWSLACSKDMPEPSAVKQA